MNADQRVFIVSISSDIGTHLAMRYLGNGVRVAGTYRTWNPALAHLRKLGAALYPLDVGVASSIDQLTDALRDDGTSWDIMIHASGILEPIGPFLSVDFGQWRDGFAVNCLGPLHLVHALYPLKAPEGTGKVLFFAGGGTNGPFDAYSCYCAGKWVLLKMTELLDSECANLQVSIIGTGWVNTKIHAQTLSASEAAGMNLEKTRAFLSEPGKGVSLDTVADCVDWCLAAPRAAVSGRNFSLVSDPWRDPQFIEALIADSELCKFRRIADFPPMNAVPGQAR